MLSRPSGSRAELVDLVEQARSGNEEAWNGLVKRLSGVVWKTMITLGVRGEAAFDVSQITWLRLLENLDRIRQPEKLPGWLATTARNESLTYLRRCARTESCSDLDHAWRSPEEPVDTRVLNDELSSALRLAFQGLSVRCQRLLRLLTVDPPLTYAEIADLLDMKPGNVGATRARCLQRLRRSPALAAIIEA